MNILFICKHNRYRSKIAEYFFNKLNKNKKHKTRSAGIIQGCNLNKSLVDYLRKHKIKLTKKQTSVSSKLINWQDLTIIVADDVPSINFRGLIRNIRVWKIKDEKEALIPIKKRVEILVKELN